MQIQPISNSYQTQRTQKQNNPSFKALIKPVDERVFGNIINDLDRLIFNNNNKGQGRRLQRIKEDVTEIMGCLMDHNNDPKSHLRANASCRIPIVRAQLQSDQVTWADSAVPDAIHNFARTAAIGDAYTGLTLTMQNGKEYGFPYCGIEATAVAQTIAKIQADALEIFQGRQGAAHFYNKMLQTGGKIENEIL